MSDFLKDLCDMRQNVECCPGNTYLDCEIHGRVKYFLPVYHNYVDVVIDIAHTLKCTLAEAWAYWDIRRRNVPTGDAGSLIPDAILYDFGELSDEKTIVYEPPTFRESSVEKTIVYKPPTFLPQHASTNDEEDIKKKAYIEACIIEASKEPIQKKAYIEAWLIEASKALSVEQQAHSSPWSRSPLWGACQATRTERETPAARRTGQTVRACQPSHVSRGAEDRGAEARSRSPRSRSPRSRSPPSRSPS